MRNKAKNTAGMTLIELMFACGVLATGLSLLFGSLISINLIGEVSTNRTVASAELAGVLEELRTGTLREVLTYTPPELQGPGVERALQLECYDTDGNAVTLPVADLDNLPELPNPLEVKATLVWSDEQGRVFSRAASTRCVR